MQLTQKETELLKELKGQEELCIGKYKDSANKAVDPQLKDLFTQIASAEQQHLDAINQIENGGTPSFSGAGGNQPSFSAKYNMAESEDKKNDSFLCTDLLTMEKHASHLYDTFIFEFTQDNLRTALNTIQKQEQGHGKMIYDYMSTNSMYS